MPDEKNAVGPTAKAGEVARPEDVRPGFEEPTDSRDLIIPFVKLFQGNPTEADQYPNAKGGDLLNSLTQDVLGAEFVPCFKWTEYTLFNSRKEGNDGEYYDPAFEPGAVIWKTTIPTADQAAMCEFGPNGEKPKAVRSLNFMCFFAGQDMPLVLRFAKTSFGAGKKLLSLAQYVEGPMFGRKYKLTTKKEQDDARNIYYVMQVNPSGKPTEEEFKTAERYYKDLKKAAFKVHEETEGARSASEDAGFSE